MVNYYSATKNEWNPAMANNTEQMEALMLSEIRKRVEDKHFRLTVTCADAMGSTEAEVRKQVWGWGE